MWLIHVFIIYSKCLLNKNIDTILRALKRGKHGKIFLFNIMNVKLEKVIPFDYANSELQYLSLIKKLNLDPYVIDTAELSDIKVKHFG